MASVSILTEVSFNRYPLAPLLIAPKIYSVSSKVVSTKTFVSGRTRLTSFVATTPFISGMRISMSTTSGLNSSVFLTASAPLEAMPTTSKSSQADSTLISPSARIG